jgi:hypothetical protein
MELCLGQLVTEEEGWEWVSCYQLLHVSHLFVRGSLLLNSSTETELGVRKKSINSPYVQHSKSV